MDVYLESASALLMLTGIFRHVDVCLHYSTVVEIVKCESLVLFFNKLLLNFKINVKKIDETSSNTRGGKLNSQLRQICR